MPGAMGQAMAHAMGHGEGGWPTGGAGVRTMGG